MAASELESISRHLRLAGDGELVRELNSALRRSVQPVVKDIREQLIPRLPNSYAQDLDADLAIRVSVRSGERNPGVALRGVTRSGRKRKLRRLDAGVLEHPLWGNRRNWYRQGEPSVQAGFFTGPARDAAPRVRAEIEKTLEDVAAKAARKGP